MTTPAKPDSVHSDESWQPVSFDCLGGWALDDHRAAFEVFKTGAEKFAGSGSLHALEQVFQEALALGKADEGQARSFFERHFTPHQYVDEDQETGFVTGYFEPEVNAALQPDGDYCVPLYCRPDDLVEITKANRTRGLAEDMAFGRVIKDRIEPYYDRKAIQSGALQGKGLELVWLKDKTDAFFIHVQGSARVLLPDGEVMRLAYAAKSGHPYTSIGRILAHRLGLSPQDMTADVLADWMRQNPDSVDDLMAQNQSYIFFQVMDGLGSESGPIGAAGVPLTPGRSLAVDYRHHAYGLPIWVNAPDAQIDDDGSVCRLMVAQDTGSAIIGPQRGDLFVGSGDQAGYLAGKVRSKAMFHILVPVS